MTKRNQCWECLKRRLVCDFTHPHCKKCAKRGFICPGYGQRPLKWKTPLSTNLHASPACANSLTNTPDSSTDSSVEISEDDSQSSHESTNGTTPDVSEHQQLSLICLNLIDGADYYPFQAVEYYNSRIGPEMVAFPHTNRFNPFLVPWAVIHCVPRSMMNLLVSVCLQHRLLQIQNSIQSIERVNSELFTRLLQYRVSALRLLQNELSTVQYKPEEALRCIISFLLADLQHPSSGSWKHHIKGAIDIVNMKGGERQLIRSSPEVQPFLRYLILVDVMSLTTSPITTSDQTDRQLRYISLPPEVYDEGLSTTFPCPHGLFVEVIHVNRLRSVLKDAGFAGRGVLSRLASDIVDRVNAFDTDLWAEKVVMSDWQKDNGNESELRKPDFSLQEPNLYPSKAAWVLLATIFKSAVALYCLRALAKTVSRTIFNRPSIKTLQDVLLQDLREIYGSESKPTVHLSKMLLWPLVIAGLGVTPHSLDSEFITQKLTWLSASLGTSAALAARSLLEQHWEEIRSSNQKQGLEAQSWQ